MKKHSKIMQLFSLFTKGSFFCLLITLLTSTACANNITYFLDAFGGNDENTGKSIHQAWKTLTKLNSASLLPGDNILLRRGQIFNGTITLKASGLKDLRIKIGTYGVGNRPVINARGYDFAVQLMDASFWEISGLETTGGNKAGIYVGCTKDDLILKDIRIINCYVHDIGDTTKVDWELSKSTGGIIVVNGNFDKDGKPLFYNSLLNEVLIENCTVRFNHRWTCISISSGKQHSKRGNANRIRNCTAEYSSADAIRMNGVTNSYIEFCTMYRNGAWPIYPGKNLGGLGAWFFDAENCTIQYCEASHIQAASTDGGAFDIDYLQKNSIVQYSYGHDCSGYGVSIFGADSASPTINSIVRHNVFANNGRDPEFAHQGDFFVFTWGGGLINGYNIYENVSYWNPSIDTPAVRLDADVIGMNTNVFSNNLILSKTSKLVYRKNDSLYLNNNHYWYTGKGHPQWTNNKNNYNAFADWQVNTGQDKNSLYQDPLINNWEINPKKRTRAQDFTVLNLDNKAISLSQFKGSAVLLVFIDLSNSSEEQAMLHFARSMQKQYGESGLRTLFVCHQLNKPNNREFLLNFANDHEIRETLLVIDDKKKFRASNYGVNKFPATFLITAEGFIEQSWPCIALSSQLAIAIEKTLGERVVNKHFELNPFIHPKNNLCE